MKMFLVLYFRVLQRVRTLPAGDSSLASLIFRYKLMSVNCDQLLYHLLSLTQYKFVLHHDCKSLTAIYRLYSLARQNWLISMPFLVTT